LAIDTASSRGNQFVPRLARRQAGYKRYAPLRAIAAVNLIVVSGGALPYQGTAVERSAIQP